MVGKQRQNDRNRVISDELRSQSYDSARFTVASGLTDYDTRTNESDMFDILDRYSDFMLWADQEITVKFNGVTNKNRLIETGQVFSSSILELTDLFITNSSGEVATINFYGTYKGE